MKAKHHYLLAAMGAMMLASCSNDDVPGNKPGGGNFEGEGIMTLSLKFAGNESDALTRVWDNTGNPDDTDFENGTFTESEIKNVTVYYFSIDNSYMGKAPATFDVLPGDESNIEHFVEAVVPADVVKTLMENENASANIIVVINKSSDLPTLTSASTYDDFNAAMSSTSDDAGFMMTSVNYAPVVNGSKTPTYFTSITSKNIGKKGGDAPEEDVEVYVERVCGKVTLDAQEEYTNTDEDVVVSTISVKNWGLNVRNKKVFPVKVIGTSFLNLTTTEWPGADNWTNQNAEERYRSYWAEDPNYDSYKSEEFTVIEFSALTAGKGATQYCLENTFDNSNQDRNQTTTAVVYAQFQPTGITGTWVMSNNRYYALDTYVDKFLVNNHVYKQNTGGNGYVSATATDVTYEATEEVKDSQNNVIGATGWTFNIKDGINLYIWDGNNEAETNFTLVNDAKLTSDFATYSQNASIYVNGYCYYEIPIRHFNDKEVPLAEAPNVINDQTQLGRYGIVRNHHYKLTINSIKNPGKPIEGDEITPEITPDDPGESYYMNVTINVLRWAVRTQEVDL